MKRIYWFYAAAVFYWIGLYVYSPILPGYIKGVVGNLSIAGSILSMYGLVQALVRLPFGITADAIGKRRLLAIIGLLAVGISAVIISLSTDAVGMYIGRSLTGFSAGAWVPLSALILIESDSNIYITTATLSLLTGVGRIFAVSITPLLINSLYGYAPAFWAASIFSLLSILILLFVRGMKPETTTAFSLSQLSRLITQPLVLLPGILNALLQFGSFASTFTFIPLIGSSIGLTNGQISMIMNVFLVSSMIANVVLNKLLKSIKENLLAFISFLVMAVGLVGAAFASNFFSLAVAQLAIGFAFGLCYPLFMGFSVSNADPHNRSTAMGLFQAVYAIGMSAGPAFSTWMAERTSVPIMMATVGIIIVVFGGAVLQLYAHFTDQKVIQKISRD